MTDASDIDPRSTFQPEYVEQAKKLAQLGATDAEIADFFEVQLRSLYRWRNRHSELADAMRVGKEAPDERVKRSLYQRATGYDYVEEQAIKIKVGQYEERVEVVEVAKHAPASDTAIIFWLKNRCKEEFRDKQEHEHTGKDGAAIKAEVTVQAVLAAMKTVEDEC